MTSTFVFIFSFFSPFSLGLLIPVNVINLEKDKDRWEGVTGELIKGGVDVDRIHRIPAIYGKELSDLEVQANTTMLARIFATRGMIGCYLSHRSFWKKVSMGSEPHQVVLEDDVILHESFYDHLHEAVEGLEACLETKETWDVLILGGFGSIHPRGQRGMRDVNSLVLGDSRSPRIISTTDRLTLHLPRRPFGTQAYVLSRRGADKLVKEAWYAAGHVDCVIWGIQKLNIVCCDPLLAHQNMSFASTIGSNAFDSCLPDTMLVDQYSKITVKWALGEPLIRIPIINKVLTVGKAICMSAVSALIGIIGRKFLPWLLPGQAILTAMLILLLRLMSKPVPA